MRFNHIRTVACLLGLTATLGTSFAADNPFLGGWELTIPGGAAGWLGVEEANGGLKASLLWGGGSVVPLDGARIEKDQLVLTRKHSSRSKDASGKTINRVSVETITATADGDALKLTSVMPRENGQGQDKSDFTGRREPPMPPAPDLSQVKFGEPDPALQRQGPDRLAAHRPERDQRLERERRTAGQCGVARRGQTS